MKRRLAFAWILGCLLLAINIPTATAQQGDGVVVKVTYGSLPAGWKDLTDTYSGDTTLLVLEKNLPSSGEFPGAMGEELTDGMSIEVMRGRRLCGWSCPEGGKEMAEHFETMISDTPFSYMDRTIEKKITFLGYQGHRVSEDGNNYCAQIHIWPSTQSRLQYWLDIGEGEWVYIFAGAASFKQCDKRFPPDDYVVGYIQEIERVLAGLRFSVERSNTTARTNPVLPEETSDGGIPWVTVIGALAAGGAALTAAAAAIAAAAIARKKSKAGKDKKESDQEEEETAGYILQISQDHLTLQMDRPVSLQATVWEVDMKGRTKRAQNAVLEIEAPQTAPYLRIAPARAQGVLDASLTLTDKPAVPSLQLTVRGSAGGSSSTAQVTLDLGGEMQIEIETDGGRRSLRADGKDGFYVYARVTVEDETDPEALKAAQESLEFKIEGAGKDWVDSSPPQEMDDWQCIYLRASNPDALRPAAPPPGAVEVKVKGEYQGQKLSNSVVIDLLGPPVLKISENYAAFLLGQAETSELQVWVEPADEEAWEFDFKLEHKSVSVDIHLTDEDEDQQPGGRKKLVITECGFADQKTTASNGLFASDRLRVFAEHDDLKIYNDVDISIYQEGLFIDSYGRAPDGAYHLKADGKKTSKEIDFRLLVWNTDARRLEASREKGLELSFSFLNEDDVTVNMMEVAQLRHEPAGLRQSNLTAETYRFWLEKELPSDGETRIVQMQAQADIDTAEFKLGVETLAMPSYLPRDELARCQHMIDKHAPPGSKAKLQEILDKKSVTLGPEGLYQLRLQLWNTTQAIIQGEGGQGYHAEAVWADRITRTLEWTKWAGDHCFNVLVSRFLGPAGSLYGPPLKNLLIDFLSACINEGKTPEEWLQGYFIQIAELLDDLPRLLDMLAKEGWEKAKQKGWQFLKQGLENRNVEITFGSSGKLVIPGWLVFKVLWAISGFASHVYYGKKSIYEAARLTIWDVSDEMIGDYLMELGMKKGHLDIKQVIHDELSGKESIAAKNINTAWQDIKDAYHESGRTDAPAPTRSAAESELEKAKKKFEAERKKKATESEAAQKVRQGTKAVDGKLYADKKDVIEIMKDPAKVRTLKNAPKDVQEAFENTRNKIYAEHDAKLTRWVKNNIPEAKNAKVIIDKFRTPGKGGSSLGTDNDYRVCVEYVTPDGKRMRIEIDQRKWDGESYRIFSEITGGPTDYEGSRTWAQGLQQLGTDRYNIEASPDFSDQATVWVNEKGWEVDPKTYKGKVIPRKVQVKPNIISVKEGKATLKDPDYMGKMYNTKVGDALHKGSKGDAYVQANKAVETLRDVRDGYSMQGYKITDLSPEMEKGMKAIEIASKNFDNGGALEWADSYLAENGLGNLESFTEKMASQFASLKLASK